MIVLGIDPGSIRTGWGAIETAARRGPRLLDKGVLAPPRRLGLEARLAFIHRGVAELITRLRPDLLAVEDVFHAVNARSALVLGHVRGVVLLAGAQAELTIRAFPPATVKAQTTGSGRAEKRQVAFMVARHLALAGETEPGDAADALAVALCAASLDSPLAAFAAARGSAPTAS